MSKILDLWMMKVWISSKALPICSKIAKYSSILNQSIQREVCLCICNMEINLNSIGIGHGFDNEFGNDHIYYFKQDDFVGIGLIKHPNSEMECFVTWNGKLMGKNNWKLF